MTLFELPEQDLSMYMNGPRVDSKTLTQYWETTAEKLLDALPSPPSKVMGCNSYLKQCMMELVPQDNVVGVPLLLMDRFEDLFTALGESEFGQRAIEAYYSRSNYPPDMTWIRQTSSHPITNLVPNPSAVLAFLTGRKFTEERVMNIIMKLEQLPHYDELVVFVSGGGCEAERLAVEEYANDNNMKITYGCTKMLEIEDIIRMVQSYNEPTS